MRIAESNARFTQMNAENIHARHAMLSNKRYWRNRLKHQFGYDIWKLPVCGGCEGYAKWHMMDGQKVGVCECGHITKNPITVEEYYERGLHIDYTLHPNAPKLVDRIWTKPGQISTVWGGEAGLCDVDKKIIVATH